MLLPGDPGRAMRLAQSLLDEPKMFNHNRGLWGYTGNARDGQPLTIQATGMGGPTTAIIASELVMLGATKLLRVGTCGGLDPELELGQLVAVTGALCDDGTSRALGGHGPLERVDGSEQMLTAVLAAAARAGAAASPVSGLTVSTDLFYDAEDRHDGWRAAGARVVEMEASTLFTLARLRGVQAGCMLLVSDLLVNGPVRISPDLLTDAELRLGEWAVAALGS